MYDWLKFFHVLGMVLYVGGFLALTRLLGHAVKNATAESREDAYRVYKRMHKFVDWIGLGIMVVTGLWLLIADPMSLRYMKNPTGYFHIKLTGVLVVVICDVVLSMKLFKMKGDGPQPNPAFFKMMHGIAALGFLGALAAIFLIRG